MFSGSFVALVTPFRKGSVDYPKLRELVEFHLKNGSDGIVVCATTGEAPTLTKEEKLRIIRETVRLAQHKLPVIAYTGTNDTRETIKFTKLAQSLKIDAALVVVPYYNKPSQQGLYFHFKSVAHAVKLPIIIYNVPGRTVTSINAETVAQLSKIKNIVAIKDASGSLDETSRLRLLSQIIILSGEDALTFPMLAVGASGVISVLANIVPAEMSALIKAFQSGDLTQARELHYQLYPLAKAMFIETNPVPVKTAMKLLGQLNGEVRPPLCPMHPENVTKLKATLKSARLL